MSDIDDAAKAIGSMGFDADMAKNLIEMVSISFHAGREESAAEIERLRAQAFKYLQECGKQAVRADTAEAMLASARKALEEIESTYQAATVAAQIATAALLSLTDEKST